MQGIDLIQNLSILLLAAELAGIWGKRLGLSVCVPVPAEALGTLVGWTPQRGDRRIINPTADDLRFLGTLPDAGSFDHC